MITQQRVLAGLLCGAMLSTSGPVGAQTPASPPAAAPGAAASNDSVSSVTVIGRRVAPGADAPRSATCEFLVANDPILRAQLAQVATVGNALLGPKVFLPTRAPRHNNYAAAPLSEPGSPLPPKAKRWRAFKSYAADPRASGYEPTLDAGYALDGSIISTGLDAAMEGSILAGVFGGAPDASRVSSAEQPSSPIDQSGYTGMAEFTREQAIQTCRTTYSPGGRAVPLGRAEIARNDETLPDGMFLFGEGRYDEALVQFRASYNKLKLLEGGDEAALMIGKIYLLAMGDRSDPREAVVWLKRAANGPYNPVNSVPQFDPKAPELNTAMGEASLMLARIYLTGFGAVAKDPVEARKWIERASYVGHVPATKTLGDIYYTGRDTPRDLKQAFALYRQAATLGYAPAQFALAEMYYAGDHGAAPDVPMALAWYKEAAKLDHAGSLYALAVAYDTGEGVRADPAMAVGFFKTAAIAGSVPAKTALGTYFYQGDQVARDQNAARQWFLSAAKNGDADAMFNLGAMMMKGEGGDLDRARAWAWFKLAQAGGKAEAPAAISAIERAMTPEEKVAGAKLLSPSAS